VVQRLFPGDGAPALIIHCKGTFGVVGDWETHTICWADIADVEVGYQSIKIETHNYYGYDSGPNTTDRGYWPVDLNSDGLHDLLVLAWGFGEQGKHFENDKGESVYDRFPYDEPEGLRLIQRKEIKGCPWGIHSDKVVNWSEVLSAPQLYREHIRSALSACQDSVWKKRLKEALSQLTDQKQHKTSSGQATPPAAPPHRDFAALGAAWRDLRNILTP